MTRGYCPKISTTANDLICLCSGDMKQNAAKFCEFLKITSVNEISKRASAFQIGFEERDKIEVKDGSFYMAVFLFVVSFVFAVPADKGNADYFTFVFKGELGKRLVRAFFDDETCKAASEKNHRNLYLLLKGCKSGGVHVKIFK